jgi:hypothetical protein
MIMKMNTSPIKNENSDSVSYIPVNGGCPDATQRAISDKPFSAIAATLKHTPALFILSFEKINAAIKAITLDK